MVNPAGRAAVSGDRSVGRALATRGASVFILAVGGLFLAMAAQLPLGSLTDPGPGMWPLAAAVVVVALGVLSAFTPDPSVEALETTRADYLRAAVAFLEVVLFIAAFWFFGYFFAAFLFVLVMGKTYSKQSWRRLLVAALLFGLAVHVFFALVLALPAPNPLPWE